MIHLNRVHLSRLFVTALTVAAVLSIPQRPLQATTETLIETLTISATQPLPTSATSILQAGVTYRIEASGSYQFGGTVRQADAECMTEDSWASIIDDHVIAKDLLVVYGSTIGNPVYNPIRNITAQDVVWGPVSPRGPTPPLSKCDLNHVYNISVAGNGGSISFVVSDDWNDAGGNSGLGDNSGSLTVKIFQIVPANTPPALNLPAPITAEATSATGAIVTFTATANDAEDGNNLPATCNPSSGATFPLGVTNVSCGYTDQGGLSASGGFTITVQDTQAPILNLSSSFAVQATGPTGAAVSYTVTATDAVDGPIVPLCAPASGSVFALGTTTVNCSARDFRGNTAIGSFTITVQDTQPPNLNLSSDLTLQATGPTGAAVAYVVTAADAVDGPIVPICAPASGTTFALGATTVNCSATDTRGNTATGAFTITVQDTKPPTLNISNNLTLEATSAAGAGVSYVVTATDEVDGPIVPLCAPASGATFAIGTTTVNCSATDAHGNTKASSFTITVQDTTPPDFTPPSNLTVEATGPAGANVSYSASAIDLVDGAVAPSCAPASGATFAIGTTTVNCSATDAQGNTRTGSFTVTVQDTTPPALTLSSNLTVEATGPAGANVSYSASATDLVDGAVTPSCAPASGSVFALGTTTVNCSATDAHGNTRTGSFTVTVQDITPPVLSLPSPSPVQATSAAGAIVTYSVSASDLVDGVVAASCTPASGTTFALGTTTVNCSATDAHGNTRTGSFIVAVAYGWTGFFQPVDNLPVVNTVKAGSAVPIKFSLGGNMGLDIFASGSPSSGADNCAATTTDDIEETSTASQSGLSYDPASNMYVYVWKTERSWAGGCRRLVIRFKDGTQQTAKFKFR